MNFILWPGIRSIMKQSYKYEYKIKNWLVFGVYKTKKSALLVAKRYEKNSPFTYPVKTKVKKSLVKGWEICLKERKVFI